MSDQRADEPLGADKPSPPLRVAQGVPALPAGATINYNDCHIGDNHHHHYHASSGPVAVAAASSARSGPPPSTTASSRVADRRSRKKVRTVELDIMPIDAGKRNFKLNKVVVSPKAAKEYRSLSTKAARDVFMREHAGEDACELAQLIAETILFVPKGSEALSCINRAISRSQSVIESIGCSRETWASTWLPTSLLIDVAMTRDWLDQLLLDMTGCFSELTRGDPTAEERVQLLGKLKSVCSRVGTSLSRAAVEVVLVADAMSSDLKLHIARSRQASARAHMEVRAQHAVTSPRVLDHARALCRSLSADAMSVRRARRRIAARWRASAALPSHVSVLLDATTKSPLRHSPGRRMPCAVRVTPGRRQLTASLVPSARRTRRPRRRACAHARLRSAPTRPMRPSVRRSASASSPSATRSLRGAHDRNHTHTHTHTQSHPGAGDVVAERRCARGVALAERSGLVERVSRNLVDSNRGSGDTGCTADWL